jgi:hypothetical protein
MKIAIDIDSTLHHHWDILSEVSLRRFGIELPYDEQLTWGTTRLRPEQLAVCVRESHSDERIIAAVPYPGAVEAIVRWQGEGHSIHVIGDGDPACREATTQWLERIGLGFAELHWCYEKVPRCAELRVELLIDDGPLNLLAALAHGIAAATIRHPWNRELCEEDDVVCAQDWPELERLLAPTLARQGIRAGAAN